MKLNTLHSVADYIEELLNSLSNSENFRQSPYFDSAKPIQRATIGYGFNVEVNDYLLLVLEQLGIVNGTMTSNKIANIRGEFTEAINKTPRGDNQALRTNLNQVANQYGCSFSVDTSQGFNVFQYIILGRRTGSGLAFQHDIG
jgi:hypothetical protein